MNRTEAMDLIQRQLDGDLTQEEHIALEEQLRVDSELQLFRQRLQRISAELHNLPRVTPPISLVDAILPRIAVETTVSPFQNDISSREGERGTQTKADVLRLDTPQAEQQQSAKKRLPVWLGKSAIGAVAACLLVGMFSAFGAWKKNDQGPAPAGIPGKEQPFVVAPKSEEQQENKTDDKKNPDKKTEQKTEKDQDKKNDQQQSKKTDKPVTNNQGKKQDNKGSQSRPPATQKKEKPSQTKETDKSRQERNKEFLNDLREYVKTHKSEDGNGEVDWGKVDELIKKSIENNRQKYNKDKDPQGWKELEKILQDQKPGKNKDNKKGENKGRNKEDRHDDNEQ
ncbi:UNVERIFIED_CONTAM: outer membrane biosynthesis protein TonB [Brevibacillus sp. OAP136]